MQIDESIRILIIEDDADTRANLRDILEMDQHRVDAVESVAEAHRTIDWGEFSVILLDRKLPDGNAEDLLPELRQVAPNAEILIVTGYRDLEAALECLHQGAADYILKPINPDVLRTNLGRVVQVRQAAQQLRLLDTAVRDVNEGILITDGKLEWPSPKILFVNDSLIRMTGYSREELLYASPRIFQSPRSNRQRWEQLKDDLRDGKPVNVEVINRRKDGTDYYVDLHVSPVFDAAGRVTNYVSTQRDITARKRNEELLLQSERLAAIGEMVTGLAHESRNALQRSMACLDMLAVEVADRADAADLVRRAQRAQSHLQHLYEEVQGYAAPIRLKLEIVQIDEVWREAWSHLDAAHRERIVRLVEETEAVDLQMQIDRFAVGQVFRNIFENSLAVCDDPCEIVVSCMPMLLGGQAALQISIVDNGPGFTPEQAQRIFEPFYSTKSRGTGLGMAIAKRVILAHGGLVGVGPHNQRGARIVVTLPRQARKKSGL